MLALYRLGLAHPGPGRQHRRRQRASRRTSAARTSSASSTCSRAAGCAARALRAGDHALHHGLDHPAAAARSSCPSLEKLQKEGEVGQARITQYTRYLTVGAGRRPVDRLRLPVPLVRHERRPGRSSRTSPPPRVFLIVLCLTAGTVLLMWMGELITQRGIGNGISLMIFASIVSRLPDGVQAWWTNPDQVFKVMMPFLALAVIAAIVFVQEGQRRIPVQYAKRVIGRRMTAGRPDLPAAAREHGRRDPGHLRRLDHGLPADRRPAHQHALGQGPRDLLLARTAGPTSSASRSSSSSSPTSTRRSRSTRSTRPTT